MSPNTADADLSELPAYSGADDTAEDYEQAAAAVTATDQRQGIRSRSLVYGLLPGLMLLLAVAAGWLKWQDATVRDRDPARAESVQAATDSAIAMLSYKPDTVEQDLQEALDRLAGGFAESYSQLIHELVIPGTKDQQISAVASVPAAASVSATADHAVVLLFVNQNIVIDGAPPTDSASSVRVTLDKIDGRWLISAFEPI